MCFHSWWVVGGECLKDGGKLSVYAREVDQLLRGMIFWELEAKALGVIDHGLDKSGKHRLRKHFHRNGAKRLF